MSYFRGMLTSRSGFKWIASTDSLKRNTLARPLRIEEIATTGKIDVAAS